MSRTEQARQFLQSWDPDLDELPDWIVDEIEADAELAAMFDGRFVPWDARGLGKRPEARRSRRILWGIPAVGLGLWAAAAIGLLALAPGLEPTPDRANLPDITSRVTPSVDTGLAPALPPPPKEARGKRSSAPRSHPGPVRAALDSPNTVDGRFKGNAELADGTISVLPPASGEEHTWFAPGAFQITEQDPLSTFSIDVDTASYSMVRRKLNEGYLPAPASVRVEEFVNSFPYDYPRPPDDAPFGVSFEGAPNPFDADTWLVRVGVQGKRVPSDQRRPVHLTFLVDTSGSMQSDDKLGLAKYALRELTGELVDGDTVSIVAYAGSAGLVLPPTPMSQRELVYGSLDRLAAGGSTAMGAGIELAYRQAQQTYQEGAVNRVIILSDGDANVGTTRQQALSDIIRGYALEGITLTVAGFGEGNYKDNRMEQLADQGDGNYFYIDSEKQARHVFVDQLTSTLVEIARDVKIQVSFDPQAVRAYRLLGYENRDIADRDFRNDAVDAGEIGSGHRVTALYELSLAPGLAPAQHLGRVSVRHKAPGPDSPSAERSWTLSGEVLRPSLSETGAGFRIAVAAAYFAEHLRGSPHLHELGLAEVEAIAAGAVRPEYPEDAELLSLVRRARELSGR